jgi:hypothetical protein
VVVRLVQQHRIGPSECTSDVLPVAADESGAAATETPAVRTSEMAMTERRRARDMRVPL